MPRPKTQSTRVANRRPPTSEQLAGNGLARITIKRVDGEDAKAARLRAAASFPWAAGSALQGTWRTNPYQIGADRWVFVYRPAPPAAVPASPPQPEAA